MSVNEVIGIIVIIGIIKNTIYPIVAASWSSAFGKETIWISAGVNPRGEPVSKCIRVSREEAARIRKAGKEI